MSIINRDLYEVRQTELPTWQCPKCRKGFLSFDRDKRFIGQETHQSAGLYENTGDQIYKGKFVAILVCNNNSCRELISVAGTHCCSANVVDPSYQLVRHEHFDLEYINPPPHIFPIAKTIPETVRDAVIDAFMLYWVDIASSANMMRMVLEFALMEKEVPKPNSLHKWIENYCESVLGNNDELKKSMLSIKWLGNSGSHEEDNGLNHSDLLNGFELLYFVLNEMFGDDGEKRKALSKDITGKHDYKANKAT